MKQPHPVVRNGARRSGHGLVGRVVMRWCQRRPVGVVVAFEAPEPVLARLEALDDRVPARRGMTARVLAGRRVAASDVAALRAPPQVGDDPPTAIMEVKVARPTPPELAEIGLFAHLDEPQRTLLAGWLDVEEAESGRRLTRQGSVGYAFFILRDGAADVIVDGTT